MKKRKTIKHKLMSVSLFCFLLPTLNNTHLSCEELWVFSTLCEEEHVYEVNEDAGSKFGIGRRVHDPLVDHQEHQVAKQAYHEDELRDEHKEDFVGLAKVTEKTTMMTTRKEKTRQVLIKVVIKKIN